VPKAEIEKCRTPRGGYAFTRAWFLEHGLPYPPVPGWRQAVERRTAAMTADPALLTREARARLLKRVWELGELAELMKQPGGLAEASVPVPLHRAGRDITAERTTTS
jgi:hypothetical protein